MKPSAQLLTYSTLRDNRIDTLLAETGSSDTEVLQQIQQALNDAGAEFVARHYQNSIVDYKQGASLIWSQLDPGTRVEVAGISKFNYDATLFDSLLRTSLGWLGVLTVPGPVSPVGPDSPDPAIKASALDTIGLTSAATSSPQSLTAAAAARLAGIYARQGSSAASAQLAGLATKLDPTVTGAILNLANTGTKTGGAIVGVGTGTGVIETGGASGGIIKGIGGVLKGGAETIKGGLENLAHPAEDQAATPSINTGTLSEIEAAGVAGRIDTVGEVSRLNLGSGLLTGLPTSLTQQRQLRVLSGAITADEPAVASFAFTVGSLPDHTAILSQLYQSRISLDLLPDILAEPLVASDLVLSLPHTYYFVIPIGLGDCYAALGDWTNAESSYLSAASYAYLNQSIEAPQLWAKLATLYLHWADSLYRGEDAPSALPIYQRIVSQAGTVPASALYSTTGLATGAALAQTVISQLAALIADPDSIADSVDPTIATPIVDAYIKIGQIAAGLDFYGHWAPVVPIWTFEFLQQVADQYCQYAVTTEQNVISYWDRADQAQLSRLQLSQHASDTRAEINVATQQAAAATAEAQAYQQGLALANRRAGDAAANAADYQNLQSQSIIFQACSSEVSGGNDGDPDYLNSLADQLQSGNSISGDRADITGADQLVASRLSMQYEVAAMQRTAAEMQLAAAQAQTELNAANARAAAAQGQVALAHLQAVEAQAVLDAFDDQSFTAGVWKAMGDRMYQLYRRYLAMALRSAKLMQRAYNFENDASQQVIRSDYSTDEIRGLLAADMLMADVASFTDTLLSTIRSKVQPITHTLSLAARQSYLFETQFRKTGSITFDTTPDDFDLAYPGSYGGRILHVEVTALGLTPTSGLSGTLTCGGLSFYRTPTDTWTDANPDHLRRRVQTAETLVISDFDRRNDPAIAAGDGRQSGIFSGAGVIGNWTLAFPPEVNDIDYNLITDVLISFTYQARFDPELATNVKQILAGQPGAHTAQLGLPLRWLYPDTFFDLVNNHSATLSIARSDLPLNQTGTSLSSIGLLVTTSGGHSPQALNLSLTAPGAAAASSVSTDVTGLITSATAGSALSSQLGRPAVGDWTLSVPADANPSWMTAGALDLTALANATLLLEYSYTPRTSA